MTKVPFPAEEMIIKAILDGLQYSRDEFFRLTGTNDWKDWLEWPEFMLSTGMLEKLKILTPNVHLWLEVGQDILTTDKNIRKGRIDLVIDDTEDNSRVLVETKANVGLLNDFEQKGIRDDLERICQILGTPKQESLEYGMSAFIANRYDNSLTQTLENFEQKVQLLVASFGFEFYTCKEKIEDKSGQWKAFAVVYVIKKKYF